MFQQPLEQTRSLSQVENIFASSSARLLDTEPGFKMVEHRLLVENESVQVASQANALPPLKGKDVTPSCLLPSPRSRPTGSRME